MTKHIAAFLSFAASAALISPLTFTEAVKGCNDPGYLYNNSGYGSPNEAEAQERADYAKLQFCDSVEKVR